MSSPLITPAETAEILRTTVYQLEQWRFHGRYPALSSRVEDGGGVVKRGRSVFYLRSVVEAFASCSQAV